MKPSGAVTASELFKEILTLAATHAEKTDLCYYFSSGKSHLTTFTVVSFFLPTTSPIILFSALDACESDLEPAGFPPKARALDPNK